MSTTPKNESAKQTIINKRASNFFSLYANNVGFSANIFDMSLFFGELDSVNPEKGELTIEQKVKVVMSPVQVKLLRDVLAKMISDYESTYGQIQVADMSLSIPEKL